MREKTSRQFNDASASADPDLLSFDALPDSALLTRGQVAGILGLAEKTLANWNYERKRLPFIRLSGNCVRYKVGDVRKFLDELQRIEVS